MLLSQPGHTQQTPHVHNTIFLSRQHIDHSLSCPLPEDHSDKWIQKLYRQVNPLNNASSTARLSCAHIIILPAPLPNRHRPQCSPRGNIHPLLPKGATYQKAAVKIKVVPAYCHPRHRRHKPPSLTPPIVSKLPTPNGIFQHLPASSTLTL